MDRAPSPVSAGTQRELGNQLLGKKYNCWVRPRVGGDRPTVSTLLDAILVFLSSVWVALASWTGCSRNEEHIRT